MPRPVQGRRAVQQHRVLADDLLEHIPHLRTRALHHALGALDVLRQRLVDQPLHHEGLEQLERHLLGQPALVQPELRPDHDDRTARVVDALAEQVLAEPALLALQHVADGLQRTIPRPGHRTPAAAVVEQRVDGLLQHPLLVVDDDLGRLQVEQPLQPVVPVDHAPVQVVQVRRREPATVELHHRAQVRRDHRHGVEHHAGRQRTALGEVGHDLQPLDRLELLGALAGLDDLLEVVGLGHRVHLGEQALDRLGAHAAVEVVGEALTQAAVDVVVCHQLLHLQALEGGKTSSRLLGLTAAASWIFRPRAGPPCRRSAARLAPYVLELLQAGLELGFSAS
jgi:hypothetical protein